MSPSIIQSLTGPPGEAVGASCQNRKPKSVGIWSDFDVLLGLILKLSENDGVLSGFPSGLPIKKGSKLRSAGKGVCLHDLRAKRLPTAPFSVREIRCKEETEARP